MESIQAVFVGIDVSKEELVIASPGPAGWDKQRVTNTLPQLDAWLDGQQVGHRHFILEATGPYSERVIYTLAARQASFSVVNPAQSRGMSKALCKSNKTDEQDAQTLSLLGQKLEVMPYKMPTDAQKKRKEAFSALASLQKQRQQLQNQLHAFDYRVNPNPVAVQVLREVLAATEQAIQTLEQQLHPETDDEETLRLIERIATIKGVGQQTARAFVTLFGNFQHFQNAKAFARFIGLAPTEFSSGSSVRRRPTISKNGNSKARAMLFNCARSAMRYNPNCMALYQRLVQKGKNGKVALTAVMHKLARLIFGVVRSQMDYQPQFAFLKLKTKSA